MIFNIKINKYNDRYVIKVRKIKVNYFEGGEVRKIEDDLTFTSNDLTIDFSHRLTPFINKHIKDAILNHEQYTYKMSEDMSKFINSGICFNGESNDFCTFDYFVK